MDLSSQPEIPLLNGLKRQQTSIFSIHLLIAVTCRLISTIHCGAFSENLTSMSRCQRIFHYSLPPITEASLSSRKTDQAVVVVDLVAAVVEEVAAAVEWAAVAAGVDLHKPRLRDM